MILDGYGLRSVLLARPITAASYPVSVRRDAISLHASFRRSLAIPPLRFTRASPPSGCTGDFHPQAAGHARHTALRLRRTATRLRGLTATHTPRSRHQCRRRRIQSLAHRRNCTSCNSVREVQSRLLHYNRLKESSVAGLGVMPMRTLNAGMLPPAPAVPHARRDTDPKPIRSPRRQWAPESARPDPVPGSRPDRRKLRPR